MPRWVFAVGVLVAVAGPAAAQLSSPPPAASRASSGLPLSETFTPSTLFPTNPTPAPPPPIIPPPVLPIEPGEEADGGLLPPRPPPKAWSGGLEIGANGATGNTELFNFRGGWNFRRKTEDNALTSDFLYVYSRQNGSVNSQQALFNARDEILFPGSRWTPFAASQVEYDELRAYRFRVGTYVGVGYTVIDDAATTFKLRAGAGAVRELGVGGPQDRWVPELLFGYDARYKLNDRSSFVSILDYYPRLPDPGQFRVRARTAYEYVLDPATGTVLRLGVQDRYDSDPGNARRNDLNYFATFGLKF